MLPGELRVLFAAKMKMLLVGRTEAGCALQ
jgi:hypothetical protein